MTDEDGSSLAGACATLERRARYLASKGAYAAAIEKCCEVLRFCPQSIEILRLRGNFLVQLGKLPQALEDLDKVVGLSPRCPEYLHERGFVNLRAGNLEAALDDFNRCLAQEPDFLPALSTRSFILLRHKRYSEALSDISRVIELRPGNDADLHNRAVILTAMRRHGEAIRNYEAALHINPNSGGSHNNLAWLLAMAPDSSLRNGSRAVKHARKALEIGMIGAWMDTLAAALAESGDFEEAIVVQKRAYEMSEPKNKAFRHRISIYRRRISYATWRENRRQEKQKRQIEKR